MTERRENPEGTALTTTRRGGSRPVIVPKDKELDKLLQLLSRPTQSLSADEYLQSIAQRQEAVNKHLLMGGVDKLRLFFDKVKAYEEKEGVQLDLSMLEISGKILGGLYLPGANLEKLVFTDSDITGSDLTAANLSEAVAVRSVMREVVATGSNWTNAVISGSDLSGARFIGARFINTVMPDVIVNRDTNFTGALIIGAHIGKTDIYEANTTGAVIRGLRR